MRFITRLLLIALAIMGVSYFIPGISVRSFWVALLFALILGVVNALIRPLIILLTLPINLLTLGLFTLIINAFTFWLASKFIFGVEIASFASAFWGALIIWIVSWLANQLLKGRGEK
jgi:putative membrane protein